MTGCSDSAVVKQSSEDKSIKLVNDEEKVYVGFILDTLRDARWYGDKDAFENEVIDQGGNVKTLAANGLADVQIQQAELLIAEGVDDLVVVTYDGDAVALFAWLAMDAGMYVY